MIQVTCNFVLLVLAKYLYIFLLYTKVFETELGLLCIVGIKIHR